MASGLLLFMAMGFLFEKLDVYQRAVNGKSKMVNRMK